MALSRRKFLKAGTSIALAAAIPMSITGVVLGQDRSGPATPSRGEFPLPSESYQDPIIYFRKSTFSPYVNTTFKISRDATPGNRARRTAPPPIEVTLINVDDTGTAEGRASDAEVGKECFSLIFRASGTQTLKQNTYTIEHGALGKFALFLTPAGTDTRGRYYEAVINHRSP
ncbi:MAG: twin-arginine translocation signal domain-containing protein [Pyrinomonadaceae bacterium]